MKRIVLSIFTLAVTLLAGAQDCILTGRVIDNNNEPISYATIVLLRDSIQVVGGITNDGGIYTLKTTAGDYRMVVSHVAYNEHQQVVALRDSINLGDIVLSLEKAKEQAEEYGHSFNREVAFLCVHSMLHLLGYDHERSEEEDREMRAKQTEIMRIMGLEVK